MATPFGVLTNVIEETLSPSIYMEAMYLSPTFKSIMPSTKDVSASGEFGEGYVCRKTIDKGLAGSFAYANIDDGSMQIASEDAGSPNFNVVGTSAFRTYQGADQSTTPAVFRYHIPLTDAKGNLHIPNQMLRAGQLSASIDDVAGRIVSRTAKKIALNMCNAWWSTEVTSGTSLPLAGVIGSVNLNGVTVNNGAVSSALVLQSGSIRSFANGQEVEIWRTGTNEMIQVQTKFYVSHVDYQANSLKLVNGSGGNVTFSLTNPAYLTIPGPMSVTTITDTVGTRQIPFGLFSVLKTSGTIYGKGSTYPGISLTLHPDHRSYQISVGSALDEAVLRRVMARAQQAQDGFGNVTRLLGSPGVWSAFAAFQDSLYTFERNGKPLDIEAGISSPGNGVFGMFHAFGKSYELAYDPWMPAGKVVGHNFTSGNWMLKAPPRLPGAGGDSRFPGLVEFIAKQTNGGNGIFVPTLASNQITGGMYAPFNAPHQFVADEVPGVLFEDITEDMAPALSAL
jgi:hypothetical protein